MLWVEALIVVGAQDNWDRAFRADWRVLKSNPFFIFGY